MHPDDGLGTCPTCGAGLVQNLASPARLPTQSVPTRLIFDDPECPNGCPRPSPEQLPADDVIE